MARNEIIYGSNEMSHGSNEITPMRAMKYPMADMRLLLWQGMK
jgi:hypothetical protein